MTNRKTFRLFISSTFDDFRKEREVLQTKVFPYIKDYCSKLGYTFQPIDLRWGVNNEAQLDQKTLELCLNEVRSCKSYPYPNFLIMIGDRYGWIPLPYIIEKTEFEALLSLMSQEEVDKMKIWYKEDLNQLPASYILKERKGEFESFEVWNKVEEDLRSILQITANKSMLSKEQKRKYFLSATEAEVEEGIIPYLKPTKHQKILIQEKPELLSHDANSIFGFFRDIDIKTKKSEKFITSDFVQAQTFKKRVKTELSDENILHSQTTQFSESTLDEQYLTQFVNKTISFLKCKLEEQKEKEKNDNFSPLDLEIEAQNYFAQQKRENFIGQESLLQRIETYINNDNPQPLVIYGESGKGKSSLIAKAVEEAKKNGKKKIISRFIGATAHSAATKEILTSIFSELGIDVRSDEDKRENIKKITIQSLDNKRETFEQFSYRIYDEILCLKDDVTIFIDAVDQLSNNDQFLWLPNNLPHNVKIIISALSDERYEEDSKYFEKLKTKTKNIALIKPFEKPVSLLKSLLRKEYRTIQKHQEEYFLKQFEKSASPFYVFVAALEMKYWKSFDLVAGQDETKNRKLQNLADSQYGIIYEFIENLSTIYHHEKKLVQKVLGYIFASQDGLSESEILELLSIDEDFVKQMAPDTWHDNLNKVLPLVIWTRLYASLKPFLSLKQQDGEELLYFFHREFENIIQEGEYCSDEHQDIIFNTILIVKKVQEDNFSANRWGKILANLITKFKIENTNDNITSEVIKNIAGLYNEDWKMKYLDFLVETGVSKGVNNHAPLSIIYFEFGLALSENRINQISKALDSIALDRDIDFGDWAIRYIIVSKALMHPYILVNRFTDAFDCINTSHNLSSKLYQLYPKIYDDLYCRVLNDLGFYYFRSNKPDESIRLLNESIKVQKSFIPNSELGKSKSYITSLALLSLCYSLINKYEESIDFGLKVVKYSRATYYTISSFLWTRTFIEALLNLSGMFLSINDFNQCLQYGEEALHIIEKNNLVNKNNWVEHYGRCLSIIAEANFNLSNYDKAEKFYLKACSESKENYKGEKSRWGKSYGTDLNNLGQFYLQIGKKRIGLISLQKSITILEPLSELGDSEIISLYATSLNNLAVFYISESQNKEALELSIRARNLIQKFYDVDEIIWGELFSTCLINLGMVFSNTKNFKKALEYEKESFLIRESLYNLNPNKFTDLYLTSLNNLAGTYSSLKLPDKAIPLLFKTLELVESGNKHIKDKYNIIKIKSIHDLSYHLFDENDPTLSIALLENGKIELEKLFEYDIKWKGYLVKFIKGLIVIYGINENEFQVRKLKIELDNLT